MLLAPYDDMRTLTIALALSAGCMQPTPSTAPPPSMPWLHGLTTVAASDVLERTALDRALEWQGCEDPCSDTGGIDLVADVVPGDAAETVLATYSGLVVLDGKGQLVMRGRGFEPTGSADELLAMAVGDAMLPTPVIAVSARVGGRREHAVWLHLYRVGRTGTLERVFAAVTEEHDEADLIGNVTLVSDGLLYKAPRGTTTDRWTFDTRANRYRYAGPGAK